MNIDTFPDAYLTEVSNERDPDRRHAAIGRLFDANVLYVDQDGPVRGRDEFTRRIDDLAARMSPTMRFDLQRAPQHETDSVLWRWQLAEPGQPPVVSGAEGAIFDTDRVVRLYSIID